VVLNEATRRDLPQRIDGLRCRCPVLETDGQSEFGPVTIDEPNPAISTRFFKQFKVSSHLRCPLPGGGRLRRGTLRVMFRRPTPVQLAVDQFQQRLGRLGQVVGVRRAQLVAVKEDVADPLQLAGGHQRPAVKQVPDSYGAQQGVGFGGWCAVDSLGNCCSSSSNGTRGSCDTMGEENIGFEGIGGHEDLPW